ncbi:RM36 protein, partial [Atractosteus spatula]|nr:RM36 protein [Atractosteus spatula]
MAFVVLKRLTTSFTRQLSYLSRYTANPSSRHTEAYRCLSSVAALQPKMLTSVFAMHGPKDVPVLRWSQLPGMKTKTALKRRCQDCFFVRRRGKLFVFCKTNPRHKQRQG